MVIKCDYCGSNISDQDEKCPFCGAPNDHMIRSANGIPKTVDELVQWYQKQNLPSYETTRFFIGQDYKGPKAFGIYKVGDTVTVYKNKSDGSRAVRYEGPDEAYAVNELYQRLQQEIANQVKTGHIHEDNNPTPSPRPKPVSGFQPSNNRKPTGKLPTFLILLVIIICFIIVVSLLSGSSGSSSGYHDNSYYNSYDSNDSNWFDSDDDDSWFDSDYDDSWDSNDWDSDWSDSYDSGGWDSGGSDWDSDW